MLTANTQFSIELRALIGAEIEKIAADVLQGVMSEAAYRTACGKIAGLNLAIDCFDDAHKAIEEKR